MSDTYKKSVEKIKLGNRNACIYTKGTYLMHGMYPVQYKNLNFSYWPADKEIDSTMLQDLIQWNDLSTDSTTLDNYRVRGAEGSCAIGSDKLIEIMNRYGIKGFIRGHQDYCGAQLYPLTDPNNCSNTINIITNGKNRKCKNTSFFSRSGWCKTNNLTYKWEKVQLNGTLAPPRVITISMANQKTGTAPLGGYIELTVESITQ